MRRKGMTLLELLLATAIITVLLAIMGSVMLLLIRAETQRAKQTEQQRVVREWKQKLDDDFRAGIQDTEQLNKAVGSETIRHFGVSGTATQLRIDISLFASDFYWQTAESSELRTIFYDFQPASGLVRREQDYAAPKSTEGTLQIMPEIVGGKFRYYDGRTWHDYWVSLDRKSAPSAVEVTFYSLPLAEANRWRVRMNSVAPVANRVVVQVPVASQAFEAYRRAVPPPKPQELPVIPPSPPAPPSPPQPQPPPPPSPFHSFFDDD